jgi:hypothetical protein
MAKYITMNKAYSLYQVNSEKEVCGETWTFEFLVSSFLGEQAKFSTACGRTCRFVRCELRGEVK